MAKRRRQRSRKANVEITEDSFIPAIRMAARQLSRQEVHIGMQGDAELAMIAGVHEYGSAKMGIPARPFIGSGLRKSKAKITKLVRADLTNIMQGRGKSIPVFLDSIGELGKQITVANFDRIKKPALSPIYARYKKQNGGSKKLLQRDDELRESLTYIKVQK